jgi:hypothetical protein
MTGGMSQSDDGPPVVNPELQELFRLTSGALQHEFGLPGSKQPAIAHSTHSLGDLIRRHRLEGFILRHYGEGSLPPDLLEALRLGFHDNNTSQQLRVSALSVRISRLLDEAGLSFLLLKGWPLSLQLGAQDELRGGGDVDVLVSPRDVRSAHRVLIEAGYAPQYAIGPRTRLGWSFVTFRNREMPYRSPAGEVDLHWRVASEQDVLPHADVLIERSVTVSDGRHTIRTLSPADALAATAFHFYLDYCHSIRRLVDFSRLLCVADAAVFDTLPTSARQAVSDVATLCEKLLDIELPHSLPLPLPKQSTVDYMESLFMQWHQVGPTSRQAPSRMGGPWGRNFRHLRRYSRTIPLLARLAARGAVWFPPSADHPRPIGMIQAALWQLGRLLRGKTDSHI